MQEKLKENPKTLATSGRNLSWKAIDRYWSPIWFLNGSYLSATAWKAAPANLQPSSHTAVFFAASSARVLRTKRGWGSTSMAFLDFLVVYWIRNHGNSVFDAPPALLKKRFKGFKRLTRKGKRKSIRSLVVSLKAGSVPDGCSKKHRDSKKSTAGVKPSGHPSRVRRKNTVLRARILGRNGLWDQRFWRAYLWGLCHQKKRGLPRKCGIYDILRKKR